jgi:hypothetical protein
VSERPPGAARGSGREDLEKQILAARRNPNLNFGKIVLLEELGHGGMGVVYRAWQDDLQRLVAVKVMGAHASRDAAERFLREARLVSKLRHPGIVAVHELGKKDGRPYFSMDLIEGAGLDRAIRGRKMPAKKLAETLKSVALALDFAHRNGVVHRDIKPANILLDANGSPFVTDFGLAADIAGGQALTVSGAVMGTPAYMAPEQARGRHGRPDPRTDIYSLGAVMFEGLTGVPPVPQGDIVSMVKSILEDTPRRPSEIAPQVPKDAETICLKCLCKDPAERYQSGRELADDLGRFIEGASISARPASALAGAMKKRGGLLAAAGLVAAVAIGIVAILGTHEPAGPPGAGRPAEEAATDSEKERLYSEIEDLRRQLAQAKTDEDRRRIAEALAAKTTETIPGFSERPPDVPKPPPVARYAELDREVARFLEGGRFATAAGKLSQFAARDADEELWVAGARAKIAKAEEAWFEGIAGRAREHGARQEWEAAAKAWREIADGDADDSRREAAEAQAALATENAAAAARAAKAEALRGKMEPLIERVAELAGKRDYEGAETALREFSKSVEEDAAKMEIGVFLGMARAALSRVPAGAETLEGEMIDTPGGSFVLLGATDTQVRVRDPGTKAEVTVAMMSLPAHTLVRLAEGGQAIRPGIGAFWMFEGRIDLAKKAWAGEPLARDYGEFADRLAALALTREARAALEALLQEHAKKDWKKVLEILAKRERYAAVPEWIAAADRIADIEFDATPPEKDPLFAVAPRKSALGQEWRYDFRDAAQVRDWRMLARNHFNARGAVGVDWEERALKMINVGVQFVAPVDAECRFVVEGQISVFPQDAGLALHACGCAFAIDGAGAFEVRGPEGDIREETRTALPIGKPFRLELRVTRDRVSGLLDGKEVVAGALKDPPFPETPRIVLYREVTWRVTAVSVSGPVAPLWTEEERARRTLLSRAQRPSGLAKAQVLCDGKSLGEFRNEGKGTWEPKEGGLLGTSLSDNVAAELHYSRPEHRNLRLRFSYVPHSGRCFEVSVRGGPGSERFILPTDAPGRWREVEIVAIEDAVLCLVDGRVSIASTGRSAVVAAGGLRFWLQTTSVTVRNVVLQEIRVPSQGAEWTAVFDGQKPPTFRLEGLLYNDEDEAITGTGSLEIVPTSRDVEFVWALSDCDNVAFRFEARGQKVYEFRTREDDAVLRLSIRGDSAEVRVNGAVVARDVKLPRGTGPVKLHALGRNSEFRYIFTRPLSP